MTNPTPHGQVPDALPAIQRFEVVDCIDSKHVPAVIPKPHGPWVRYEDHVTALAAGQATAAPAQPAAQQGAAYAALPEKYYLAGGEVPTWDAKQMHAFADATHALRTTPVQNPAEIEHVAGDVQEPCGWIYDWTHSSATGKPDTTYTGFTKDEAHARKHDNCIAVFTTQQPAPATQQAGWTNADADAARLALELECLLMDTKDTAVVSKWWQSANEALELHRARLQEVQPSTTAQADSQPAPVLLSDEELCQIEEPYLLNFRIPLGGQYDFARAVEKAVLAKTYGTQAPQPSPTPQADSQPAPEYVGNGMFKGETIEKAAEHWANWCDRRCMNGLAEFLRVVAARAPASSQPAPVLDYPQLPRVGPIGYASVVDIDSYAKTLTIGPHLPGVRDIALWTTDQMRAYADETYALRIGAKHA